MVSGHAFLLFYLVIMSFKRLLQNLFFGDLYGVETKKLVERLANYIIYKVAVLPLTATYHNLLRSVFCMRFLVSFMTSKS